MKDEYAAFVKCPQCGHDQNRTTFSKCEVCGFALKKGISPPPIIYLLALGVLVGGGYYAWKQYQNGQLPFLSPGGSTTQTSPSATTPAASIPGTGSSTAPIDAKTLISGGERIFLNLDNSQKQAAASAFAQGDFAGAITNLQVVRNVLRSDPETLIYLNNARIGKTPSLTIAVVVPVSDTPNPAQEILRGVAHVQDQFNAIPGQKWPIKILIADDANNADKAKAIATALSQNPEVKFVIGHGTSTTSLAAAPIYQKQQLVMMAPTSTSTELSQPTNGQQNYIFRVIPSDQLTGTALARHVLSQMKLTKVALFFNSESSYSRSLKESFTSTLSLEGGQITDEIDLAQTDGLNSLANTSAQLIALFPNSGAFEKAIAVIKANNKRIPLIGGDAMYRIETLQQAGSSALNGVFPAPWHPLRSADPQFPKTSTTLWGGTVNWRTAMSYDALTTLTAILSPNPNPTRPEIAAALSQGSALTQGVSGEIRFFPSGDRNGRVVLVKVAPGNLSGTGFDFVPLL